ncbi:efflux RND transporter periplasmic adaptor subunit [Enterobacter roggenkampii]|uniref:efflux RND transporter periplasmic adaptor subunit n=1 Tax=Enterobacter roggenkampii TaxID=1812935 RepID=UPI0022389E7D|nr:efflux RND transporter periplasmic adaptor subunit [Enterobacter roggenkampii]MCW5004217.1 efflux RND transporter periplasmic adaptor subunit [Enterobacter roggenkampii]
MKSLVMVLIALTGVVVLPSQAEEAQADTSPVRFLVQANKESPLSSVVAGRIARLNVQLGDRVSAGKVLATLDCADLTARRNAAQAEYHGAQLRYEAKAKLQGLNSAAQLEVGLAAAEVNRTRGQMGIFDAQLAQCRFVAPFDGRVARIYVKEGQGVSAGGGVIDLVGSGTPKARLNVPSGWIVWLKPGVQLDATVGETGEHYLLTVTNISARVDAVSQTIEIEAAFPEKVEGVLPGMSGLAVPQCAAGDTTCPSAGAAS